MKHISEILPNVINQANVSGEINRLTNRHIAKLFQHLEDRSITFSEFERSAIKTQFRMLQDDIINCVCGVSYERENK